MRMAASSASSFIVVRILLSPLTRLVNQKTDERSADGAKNATDQRHD